MKERIFEIIGDACALPEEITPESELKLLSLDSLSFVGAVVKLEEEFGIEFDLDELCILDWETVGDIVKCTEEKLNAKEQD